MPWSGSAPNKTFARDTGVYQGATAWAQTEAAARGIRSDDADTHDQDIASAANSSLQKNGDNKVTGNIDWGAKLITNLGGLASATELTIASSGTTDILGAAALYVAVSGTTQITSFGTGTNQFKIVRFTGILTLTHHATTLILPTGANIVTAAGDVILVASDGSSNARVLVYQRADGTPTVSAVMTALTDGDSWTAEVTVASATTCDILGAASDFIAISGTATITSFGTGASKIKFVRATGAHILTHNATTLILPGGVNILTVSGDTYIVISDASSNARVYGYQRSLPLPTGLPQGRLTLASATPIMTGDLTAQSTIYYTPYLGSFIPLWDGNTWLPRQFSELSVVLDSNSGHTGYQQSGKNFDLFVVDDAGTIRLGTGPAWTSDTGRGTGAATTELARTNGLLANANSMTLRFGSVAGNTTTVAALKGTYVGSFRATADGQTAWVATPAAAAGGGACTLFLWNCYNRVLVAAYSRDSTNSWNYTTATWQAANAGASSGVLNRISMLSGANEDMVDVTYHAFAGNGTVNVLMVTGVGLDSTSAWSGVPGSRLSRDNQPESIPARYVGLPGLGLHFFQALEYSAASGTTVWFGDNNAPLVTQMALQLQTRM